MVAFIGILQVLSHARAAWPYLSIVENSLIFDPNLCLSQKNPDLELV